MLQGSHTRRGSYKSLQRGSTAGLPDSDLIFNLTLLLTTLGLKSSKDLKLLAIFYLYHVIGCLCATANFPAQNAAPHLDKLLFVL